MMCNTPRAKRAKIDRSTDIESCDLLGYTPSDIIPSTNKATSLGSAVKLHNNVLLPCVGFGTYKMKKGDVSKPLQTALKTGYILIDTAQVYNNEKEIGNILSTRQRKSFFITSKLWRSSHTYDRAIKATKKSLQKLKLNYLDMYLIHWPGCKKGWPLKKGTTCPPNWDPSMRNDTWKAMEDIYLSGKTRAIGVSNYSIDHLKDLIAHCRIKPHVLQVEFHPKLVQSELLTFCQQEGIQLQAYASLGSGDSKNDNGSFFTLPPVVVAAKKYKKTPAQVLLRWGLEKGVCVIPKSSVASHIIENTDIFNFSLSAEDIAAIDTCHENKRNCWKGVDPASIK